MRRPEAQGLAEYAANAVDRIGEGYSSAFRAIPFRCSSMLYEQHVPFLLFSYHACELAGNTVFHGFHLSFAQPDMYE